jgi:hypothetical protein
MDNIISAAVVGLDYKYESIMYVKRAAYLMILQINLLLHILT